MTAVDFADKKLNSMKGVCVQFIAKHMRNNLPEYQIRDWWIDLYPQWTEVYQPALEKYQKNPARYTGQRNGNGHKPKSVPATQQTYLRASKSMPVIEDLYTRDGRHLGKIQLAGDLIKAPVVEVPPTYNSTTIDELRKEILNHQTALEQIRQQNADLVHQLAMKNKEIEALNILLGLRTS